MVSHDELCEGGADDTNLSGSLLGGDIIRHLNVRSLIPHKDQ